MKFHFITKSIVEGHTDKYYDGRKKLYMYPCLVFGSNCYSVEDGNTNHLDYMYNLHHDQIKRENFHEYLGYYETEFDAETRCKNV